MEEEAYVDYIKIFKVICLAASDVQVTYFPRDIEGLSIDKKLFVLLKMLILKLEERVLEVNPDMESLKRRHAASSIHLEMLTNNVKRQKSAKRANVTKYWEFMGRQFLETLFPSPLSEMFPKNSNLTDEDYITGKKLGLLDPSINSAKKGGLNMSLSSSREKKACIDNRSSSEKINEMNWHQNYELSEFISSKDKKEKCIKLLGQKRSVKQINAETKVPVRTIYEWKSKLGQSAQTKKLILKEDDLETSIRKLAGEYGCGRDKAFRAKKALKERLSKGLK